MHMPWLSRWGNRHKCHARGSQQVKIIFICLFSAHVNLIWISQLLPHFFGHAWSWSKENHYQFPIFMKELQASGLRDQMSIKNSTSKKQPAAPAAIRSLMVLWTLRALPPPVSETNKQVIWWRLIHIKLYGQPAVHYIQFCSRCKRNLRKSKVLLSEMILLI